MRLYKDLDINTKINVKAGRKALSNVIHIFQNCYKDTYHLYLEDIERYEKIALHY